MFIQQSSIWICLQIIKIRQNQENTQLVSRIAAHRSALTCVQLNNRGSLLATASESAKIVRVFDVELGSLLFELRSSWHGVPYAPLAVVRCLHFDHKSDYLMSAGNSDVINVYDLTELPELPSKAAKLASDILWWVIFCAGCPRRQNALFYNYIALAKIILKNVIHNNMILIDNSPKNVLIFFQ